MLGRECPGVVIPDTVLCLPTVNNVLIVNNPLHLLLSHHKPHARQFAVLLQCATVPNTPTHLLCLPRPLQTFLLLLLLRPLLPSLPEQSRAFGIYSLSILSWTSRCASLGTQMQKGTSINTTRN